MFSYPSRKEAGGASKESDIGSGECPESPAVQAYFEKKASEALTCTVTLRSEWSERRKQLQKAMVELTLAEENVLNPTLAHRRFLQHRPERAKPTPGSGECPEANLSKE